jgi:hypothetical protein
MSFRGALEVLQVDAATRTLHLVGKGTDTTGSSGASMDLNARVEAAAAGSQLVGTSEVSMSGKAAAFGARLAASVADQVLQQFANNFAARATALAQAGTPSAPGGAAAAPGPSPAPAGAAPSLNGIALLWGALKSWLRALLGKSAA